jgi:hypothetical protein
MKDKYVKTGSALYIQGKSRSKIGGENRTITDETLWTKSLSSSFWHQEHIILPMRIRKRDSGALPLRMPKIQRTKKEAQKRSWNNENASGEITRRHKADKTYDGIY